jgi:hypothetical protein
VRRLSYLKVARLIPRGEATTAFARRLDRRDVGEVNDLGITVMVRRFSTGSATVSICLGNRRKLSYNHVVPDPETHG